MIKFTVIRGLSALLTVAFLYALWAYGHAHALSAMYGYSEDAARSLAFRVGNAMEVSRIYAEIIAIDKMNMDRTILFATVMFVFFVLVAGLMGERVHGAAFRFLVVVALAHVVLALAWIGMTDAMSVWYRVHKEVLRAALRELEWFRAELPLLEIIKLQGILVFIEAMVVVRTVLFRIPRWVR